MNRATIKQKRADQKNVNVADPIKIDLTAPASWPDPKVRLYDVIFVVNLFQVAPVAIADGIAQVAARVLTKDGFVAIYGPFKVDGKYTTQSSVASRSSASPSIRSRIIPAGRPTSRKPRALRPTIR
jgi:hypothetical protein